MSIEREVNAGGLTLLPPTERLDFIFSNAIQQIQDQLRQMRVRFERWDHEGYVLYQHIDQNAYISTNRRDLVGGEDLNGTKSEDIEVSWNDCQIRVPSIPHYEIPLLYIQ